jgi:DNA (cytosine-5)-methyltransferase 1
MFSSEYDKYAAQVYYKNFNDYPHGDITMISENSIPAHDVLIAGFPCQPFSSIGGGGGFSDTGGTLFFDICRILSFSKPFAFLLENVAGLKGHDKGNTFRIILESLHRMEYDVYHTILCSRNFGVPQNRNRIYIVGFKRGLVESFSFPNGTNKNTCVGDILEENVSDKYTISNAMWEWHKSRKKKESSRGNGFGYSLYSPTDTHVNTIRARYYKDGGEALIAQNNKNPRMLTPREVARLQGFPESFILSKYKKHAYKQLGNSVSVPVVAAIALEIKKSLFMIHP